MRFAAYCVLIGQIILQGYRAVQDMNGPRDIRGWVPAEHMWAFLALAVIFFCLTMADRPNIIANITH